MGTDIYSANLGIPAGEKATVAEVTNHPEASSRLSPVHSTIQQRNLSSSIASNLASARGISARPRRGQQLPAQVSTHNAEGRVLKPARRSNLGEHEAKASRQDEKDEEAGTAVGKGPGDPRKEPVAPPPIATVASEDPFSRFYSTFGNLISTLSAPLAYAGLPLNTELVVPAIPVRLASPMASRIAPDPDLARYFSKAALRAVRDERGGFGGTESFYVVPTTGGTMSYAGMLSNTRQNSNIAEEDEAEFVDANENPQPPSPGVVRSRLSRPGGTSKRHGYRDNKTWEEMMVENETLKSVVLDLGERLRAFELGAQRSSRALHASVRGLSSPSGSVMTVGGIPPLPGVEGMRTLQDKLRENDEELKTLRKENKRLTRENTKFMSVIERYRERWEVLKEGARERVKGDPQGSRRKSEMENPVNLP